MPVLLPPAVAAGPRFLNGYTAERFDISALVVAAGPRFLNGYTLRNYDSGTMELPLDRDF